ncbi:MAG TPA: cytochrome c [Blastocatellia bacterium]|nr:cytochrome c [Blastocatellia bacterium]
MKKSRFAFLFTALLFAAWITLPAGASGAKESGLTFSKDVAPIFYKNCASCHRTGEIAPMSLITYKEVRPWARAIREKVITRDMPPWHADPKHGEWVNDRRMSQKDIDTIVAWVDQGAKEGNPKELPPAPKFATGWQIGEPDAVFYMPEEYTVPADGAVSYQYFTIDPGFKEDRYIEAMEARAGNLSVVHHIVIYVRDPRQNQNRSRTKIDLGEGLLGALSPGQTPFRAQTGMAKLIKAGSKLIFQMHYTPNGSVQKDRSYVGLKFSKAPVDKVVTTTAATDLRFEIPPHAANHEVRGEYEFERDSHIVSFSPHMHLRGKDILYRATYPDGRSEILLSVPQYDFNWQVYYYPKKPLPMPKGTRIEAIAHFDNSTKNALNPDPTRAVRFGEQTWDEMMNGFFDYTVDAKAGAERAEGGAKTK